MFSIRTLYYTNSFRIGCHHCSKRVLSGTPILLFVSQQAQVPKTGNSYCSIMQCFLLHAATAFASPPPIFYFTSYIYMQNLSLQCSYFNLHYRRITKCVFCIFPLRDKKDIYLRGNEQKTNQVFVCVLSSKLGIYIHMSTRSQYQTKRIIFRVLQQQRNVFFLTALYLHNTKMYFFSFLIFTLPSGSFEHKSQYTRQRIREMYNKKYLLQKKCVCDRWNINENGYLQGCVATTPAFSVCACVFV